MNGRRGATRLAGSLALVSLLLFSLVIPSVTPVAASSSYFTILGSSWASTSGEVGPGSTNAELVVVVAYNQQNSQAATALQAVLQLPTGFTGISGSNTVTTGEASVASGSVFNLKYNLTIASSVAIGTYSVPITFTTTINSAVYFQASTISFALLGTVILNYAASQSVLYTGEVNAVNFTLTNSGSGIATQVKPSVSTSVGSIVSVLPVFAAINGGSSVQFVVDIFVPESIASSGASFSSSGSAALVTFSTSYFDAYGTASSVSQTVGFHAASSPEPILQFTASSSFLIPGQVNSVPVEISNLGPGSITRLDITMTASSGYSVLTEIPVISVLSADSPVNETIRVFAPSSAAGSALTLSFDYSYIDPYGTSTQGSQSLGFYTASTSSVSTGGVLSISASKSSLVAGEQTTVSFLIKNTGSQAVRSPTFSLVVPSPLVLSSSSSLSLSNETIAPGQTISYNATISSPSSSTGGTYSSSLTVTYASQSGSVFTQTSTVNFNLVIQIRQVSVTALSSDVMVGIPSTVELVVTNTGNVPIFSPSLSLSVPSGLAVTGNATYTRTGLQLSPGQKFSYYATVASGPKTTEGPYAATLGVTYTDQYGNQYSQSFSPGLIVIGGIILLIQDLSASPASGSTLTVSGTLLNEGQGSAYYLEVTGGAARGQTGSTYVGEVDPNTPVPFSITVPYRSSASATSVNLTLVSDYMNDYGQNLTSKFSSPVSITGSSLGGLSAFSGQGTAGSSAGTDLIRYGLAAAILIAIVASALYVRRTRGASAGPGKSKGKAKSDVI